MFDALPSANGLRVQIYDPLGRLVNPANQWYDQNINQDRLPQDNLVLTMDGTYQVHVVSEMVGSGSPATGAYNFRLLDLNSAPLVNLDSTISGTFDHNGQGSFAYRFQNPFRQYIYVDAQFGNGNYYIYNADGSLVTQSGYYGL
jgi:hypothetical protein